MVLNHVAQRAGFLVIGGPGADAFCFADRDLDVVDVLVIPNRLEDAVGESNHHEVLDGLFAQIVVDPEDLRLVEDASGHGVDLLRGGKIAADGFFDDDPGIRPVPTNGEFRISSPSQTAVNELGGMLK